MNSRHAHPAPAAASSEFRRTLLALAARAESEGVLEVATALESLASAMALGRLPAFAAHCLGFWTGSKATDGTGTGPPQPGQTTSGGDRRDARCLHPKPSRVAR